MRKIRAGVASFAALVVTSGLMVGGAAAQDAPDFNGVWQVSNTAGGGASPNRAPLTPEYQEKWEMINKLRQDGSEDFYQYDLSLQCLPLGTSYMTRGWYRMEVVQTDDKILIVYEFNDQIRRIYLDGREPTDIILNDPTYMGYSTGKWEDDTLVVTTVANRVETPLDVNLAPHSEELVIEERWHFAADGKMLQNDVTLTDPVALTEPWKFTWSFDKLEPPLDNVREFACAETINRAH